MPINEQPQAPQPSTAKPSIIVCVNARSGHQHSCSGYGSERLASLLETALAEKQLNLEVSRIKCFGRCAKGPVIRIAPGGEFFEQCSEKDIRRIIDSVSLLAAQ